MPASIDLQLQLQHISIAANLQTLLTFFMQIKHSDSKLQIPDIPSLIQQDCWTQAFSFRRDTSAAFTAGWLEFCRTRSLMGSGILRRRRNARDIPGVASVTA